MPDYQVFVVNQSGTVYSGSGPGGSLANPGVSHVSFELNGAGSVEISLATTDPDAALMLPGREVQIWWDGSILFWGPIVRPQAGLDETTWQCAGLLWYFAHRYMGRADRVNQLTNGDFEAGETGWSFTGVTHAIDTGTVLEGTKSEKLTGTAADHTGHAQQTWTHPSGGYPGGDALTVSAWVYVPSADYVGGALEDFGLVARHNSGGVTVDAQVATIDDTTTKDLWIELEVVLPAVKVGDTVDVLLFPPHGVAYYDLVTLTYMESLSFGYPATPVDVTTIIGGIVDYAQNRVFDHGKSDLNIGTGGSATGVTRRVAYQFAEHRNIGDAILEFVRQGYCDIDVVITATTRTLTVYPKSTDSRTPKLGKGSVYGTTLELDVNLADFTYSLDLEQAASSVVLLGPGDGSDRPEGFATDTSLLGGAFTMEIVEQAPDDATVGQLDQRAAERLAVAARPQILEVTTLPGSGVIGNLHTGDTAPVVISDGWVNINATYRVARIEADLLKDQATITLNVEA